MGFKDAVKDTAKVLKEKIEGKETDLGVFIPCYKCGAFVCKIEDTNAPPHLKRMLKSTSANAAIALKIINKTRQFKCEECKKKEPKNWKPTKKEMRKLIKDAKKD